MESALLGVVIDSSVLIAAERRKLTPSQAIENVLKIGHGIYRANTPEIRDRRRAFLDELEATIPVHPITQATAEIVARIGGEQAASGINLPLGDLIIGSCALRPYSP